MTNLLNIEYSVYSKILGKTFINNKEVVSVSAFESFALALNLNYQIIKITKIS